MLKITITTEEEKLSEFLIQKIQELSVEIKDKFKLGTGAQFEVTTIENTSKTNKKLLND